MNHEWKRYLADTALSLKALEVRGTYTYADNYHLTLKFIGEVSKEKVEAIDEQLEEHFKDLSPFELSIGVMGVFPRKNRGIYWMGVQESKDLLDAFERVESAMEKIEIPRDERPYTAHITLLKQGRPNDMIIRNTLDLGPLIVDEIILYESINLNGKLEYIPIGHYPLGNK